MSNLCIYLILNNYELKIPYVLAAVVVELHGGGFAVGDVDGGAGVDAAAGRGGGVVGLFHDRDLVE